MLENATLVVFGLTHILFLEGATHIVVCFRSDFGVWGCSQRAGWWRDEYAGDTCGG